LFIIALKESLGRADGCLLIFARRLHLQLGVKGRRQQENAQEAARMGDAIP